MAADTTNYNDINQMLGAVSDLLNIPKPPDPPIPTPLVLLTDDRPGMSAQKIGAEVIRRRADAGLPVGVLPSGQVNPAEIMEIIRAQVILDAIATEARVTIAIQPGTPLTAYGVDASGSPVVVNGVTTGIGVGNGIIQ